MPIYRESQRLGNSITGISKKVSIQYDTDHWEINKWDGNGWITPADQTKFIPEFSVRSLKVVGTVGESAVVQYNLAGYTEEVVNENVVKEYETNVIDTFQNLLVYVERVTAVFLTGSSSTFTSLVLGT